MKRKISIFKKQIDLQMDQLKIGRTSEFSQLKKLLNYGPLQLEVKIIKMAKLLRIKRPKILQTCPRQFKMFSLTNEASVSATAL